MVFQYEGGITAPFSSINFFKYLADVVNYEHWGVDRSRGSVYAGFGKHYGIQMGEGESPQVHSVEFVNLMCFVRKRDKTLNALQNRVIAGKIEKVVPGILELGPLMYQDSVPRQDGNVWSSNPRLTKSCPAGLRS